MIYVSIILLVEIWVISSLGLLKRVLLWKILICFGEHMYVIYVSSGISGSEGFTLVDIAKQLSKVVLPT
jgi:hypothetical protein